MLPGGPRSVREEPFVPFPTLLIVSFECSYLAVVSSDQENFKGVVHVER